jgi:hypothetical protein
LARLFRRKGEVTEAVIGDAYAAATVSLFSIVRLIMFANLRYRLAYAVCGQPFMAAFGL